MGAGGTIKGDVLRYCFDKLCIEMMRNTIYLLFALVAAVCAPRAAAFSPDVYASQSRLAEGRWVKVGVPATGMYMISNAQLRQWGFADPSRVRVYGYGGQRIADALTEENYADDLPMAPSEMTSAGLVFYGVGSESWEASKNGIYSNLSSIYTTEGYYFLSDTGEEIPPMPTQGMPQASGASGQYWARTHYEYDRLSPGEAGYLLVGESFKAQGTRKFSFDLPAGEKKMEVGIVSNSGTASQMEFTVNGQRLDTNSTDAIGTTAVSGYLHGTFNCASHSFATNEDKFELTITVRNAASMRDCWLDYIAVNSLQPTKLPSAGTLVYYDDKPAQALDAAGRQGVRVWDVTNPRQVMALNAGLADGRCEWTNDYTGMRAYAVWADGAQMPTPKLVGTVANQNIHALQGTDMVIFTLPELTQQAERIAQMHRTAREPLSVTVLNVNEVYNEFASGCADVSALRKCLKMLYDRGAAADSVPTVRYALLMGRATIDNRHLTSQFDAGAYGTIPMWIGGVRSNQLSDNIAFGTDDFIAMLEDGAGRNLSSDKLCVAVGRMPLRTVSEAKNAVDKLLQYCNKSKPGTWKNSFIFLADDGNNNDHLDQTEEMIAEMAANEGQQAFYTKVYVDAYDIIGGVCEGGRQDMYRMLNEGVMWWNFAGHANNHSWTSEKMLTYNDINSLYLSRVPILLAATCDFLRWDSNTISGGELLFHERNGGTIATISATRPVYIPENGHFTRAAGRAVTRRQPDGSVPRIGDIYRNTKNDIRDKKGVWIPNSNRLRYVLMGDPAMPLAMPSNVVRLDSIGDVAVDIDAQPTLMALQRATIKGSIVGPDGQLLTDFNGTVEIDIYDAERSITTKGRGSDNNPTTFEQHGNRLFVGSAPVVNGRFTANVAMPGEVADNWRPATINMYAHSEVAEAVGVNRDFYVYGLDESVAADNQPPIIEQLVLNHSTFKSGDAVNESPMAIAQIRDDVGINLSSAGVGHQMTITIDGSKHFDDVAQYFTPSADGTPSGTISYPLSALTDGAHTMRLRVWDTSGNSAVQEVDFFVKQGLAPKIYDIACDANPASVEANFYITHDRPDGQLQVTISIFTLGGQKVREIGAEGRSDMFTSAPINWDLCDWTGRRVPRGIYVYRASITTDGQTYDTGSRKLAVTAQ